MTTRFDISPGTPSALVVDDELRIRECLEALITQAGWRCVAVESGDWAVEEVQKNHHAVVFLDLVMPGKNGPEALLEIRAADPATKVVIMTGFPDSALMLDARRFDPDALLVKPFGRDEVRSVLQDVTRPNYSKG